MHAPVSYKLLQQQLWLSADRCIFWEEEKVLIVSDLHFGKTGHFRKSGIAVPQSVYKKDLQRLFNQVQFFQPRKLIVVGDLFHSRENKELELFLKWRRDFPFLEIHLVKGNHDILHNNWYSQADIHVNEEELLINAFRFRHDKETISQGIESITRHRATATQAVSEYLFSGHIHPGVRIRGMGRQSLSLPCFYFARDYCVLPAFSAFTGTFMMHPEADENIFAIVENKIVQLQ